MKKLIPLLLMSVMVFILGSCTGNTENDVDIPDDSGIVSVADNSELPPIEDMDTKEVAFTIQSPDPSVFDGVTVTFMISIDSNGKLMTAQATGGGGDAILVTSEHEFLFWVPGNSSIQQIFRADIDSGECEPLLSETVYGFTRADYAPLAGKYESIYWCNYVAYGFGDENLIFYKSNKYAIDGEPALRYAVWFYNIETGEETRIDPPDGETVDGAFLWGDNGTVCFETYHDIENPHYNHDGENLHYNAQYSYDLATGELTQIFIEYYDPETDTYYTPETNE